ncbi:hypothetical protein BTJ68_11089 [Hortaea werneckii EXF-2000]|uniref:Uncharacterized protein n=1 Tax=Hortaea werneckii EXF-2000 TaxID=1157616 RepID=A0A1Z5SY81_HORWE|nr:hypothetical protein BTJ68_11089 [Hortaea werneckii EXF-2000]
MKSAATAWAAALAVMSISGPYTKAEAAPARRHEDGSERPKYYFPRHVKRQFTNTTTFPAADSPYASTSEPYTSSVDAATSSEPYAYAAPSSTSEVYSSSLYYAPASSSSSSFEAPSSSSEYPCQRDKCLLRDVLIELIHANYHEFLEQLDRVHILLCDHQFFDEHARWRLPIWPTNASVPQLYWWHAIKHRPTYVQFQQHKERIRYGELIALDRCRIHWPTYSEPSSNVVTSTAESGSATGSSDATGTNGSLPLTPILVGLSTVIESTGYISSASESAESSSFTLPSQSASATGALSSTSGSAVPEATTTAASNESAASTTVSGSDGLTVLPIPGLTEGVSDGATSSLPSSGLAQSTATTPPSTSATTTGDLLGGLVPSAAGEASSLVASAGSSILSAESSGSGPQATELPSTISASATGALSSLASSLSSELSSVVETNPAASESLASGFSSVLSGAASSLATEAPATFPTTTKASGTAPSSLSSSTVTGSQGTSVVPVPAATSDEVYTSSTFTGSSGTTSEAPSTASGAESSVTETASATDSGVPESASAGSTISTSIPLSTGVTATLSSSETDSLPTDASQTSASASTQTAEPTETEAPETQSSDASVTDTTATSMYMPTSLVYAPGSATPPSTSTSGTDIQTQTGSTTSATSAGLPTYMPRLVQPPGGMPNAPKNATLVQIGFNYGLNYPFVVNSENTTSQIFAYLPQGIAYGLGVSHDQIKMNALMPYDTTESMGFITTLAQAYIPSDLVNSMEQGLHTPLGNLYQNPDAPVKTLMGMVNPTIPLLPGASLNEASGTKSSNPAATTSASAGDGAPIGGDSGSSQRVKGSSVGIGVGAVAGAAVYAAAMVYIARRYRKKRASHQRASSVPSTGEMTQRSGGGMGGYFMSGANGRNSSRSGGTGGDGSGNRQSGGSSNGRSVRDQGISNPIMAENSLGWN